MPALAVDLAQRHAVRGLVGLLKALDPSRPVIGKDGWEYVSGDVIGVHDYTQHGTDLLARYGTRDAVEHTLEKERPGAVCSWWENRASCAKPPPVPSSSPNSAGWASREARRGGTGTAP